jgi:hypothetical protein
MAKILDTKVLNTYPVQRIVEASNGYIVNGCYYDKNGLTPRPFQLFPVYGSANDLAMNQNFYRAGSPEYSLNKTFGDMVIVDSEDPTITYSFSNGQRDNTYIWIHKIKETTDKVEELASTAWTSASTPSTYSYPQQCLGQDACYLYMVFTCNNSYYSTFYRINKITLEMTAVLSMNAYSICMKVKENSNYIFYAYQVYYGTASFYRYNKLTGANDTMSIQPKASTLAFGAVPSTEISIDKDHGYSYMIHHNNAKSVLYFTRFDMDYTQSVATAVAKETDCNIDWGSSGITTIPFVGSAYAFMYELFITTSTTGKKYLNVAVHENNSNTAANFPKYGIYTFLIDATTKDLVYKGFTNISTICFKGFLGIKNNEFLVCATDSSIIYATFDEASEKFVVSDTNNCSPKFIGIDLSENIWFVNGANEVEMVSPFIPTSVNLAYEKDTYKYEGEAIDTYITIEAKNYNGSNIVATLDLQIKGNGIFTSNNTKSVREATLSTGVKKIPIQITGAGNVVVYPKLVL